MRLNHVTLIVGNLERSLDFSHALGMTPIFHAPPRRACFVCPDGDSTLSVEVTGQPALPAGVQIYFEIAGGDALDRRIADLREARVVFHQRPTDMNCLWREARLADPDGHEVCLPRKTGSTRRGRSLSMA